MKRRKSEMALEDAGGTLEALSRYPTTLFPNVLNNTSSDWLLSENITGADSDNTSVEQILLENLGPKQRDISSVIILLIIYSLIFISGTLGNICTCIVIARNAYMQTTTNYYLFSLAISDVLILLFGEYTLSLVLVLCNLQMYAWSLIWDI